MADLRIVRSDGQEISCSGLVTRGWMVADEGLSDFLDLPISVETSANVLTDGSTLVSKRVDEAERTASILYVGPGDPREVRNQALAFFNPKYSFACHVTHMGETRWCEGELIERKAEILPDSYPCQVTFTILCLDPYMRGEDEHDESMQDAMAMFTFPFQSFVPNQTIPSGCVASFRVYDGLNTVYNNGGVASPFTIRAEFAEQVVTPTFHINDGFVQVVTTFDAGDVLVIDFAAAPPTVTINGANAINKCSRDSTFVGQVLEVGANTFWYEAETGDINTMTVSIQHYDRYMGV